MKKEMGPNFTAQDLIDLPSYHIYLPVMIDDEVSRRFSADNEAQSFKGIKC